MRQSEETLEDWGRFAATVNARAGTHWPRATTERTCYKLTGRSTLRPLTESSLVLLRMRAIFGLSARTEILRYFLFHPWERATAAMLAETANYAKRNIATRAMCSCKRVFCHQKGSATVFTSRWPQATR